MPNELEPGDKPEEPNLADLAAILAAARLGKAAKDGDPMAAERALDDGGLKRSDGTWRHEPRD